MPYARDEDKKLADKRRREEKGDINLQRERLFRRLVKHYEENCRDREVGRHPTSLEPKPKKNTLDKYGIVVFLADPRMFPLHLQSNKNEFIQVQEPELIADWQGEDHVLVPPNEESPHVEDQLDKLKATLDAMNIPDASDGTKAKRFATLKNLLSWTESQDLAESLNSGVVLEYINTKECARNTKLGFYTALYFFTCKHDLIKGVTDDTKKKIEKFSADMKDTVKYHQHNQEEIAELFDVKPMSEIIKTAEEKFAPLSDELVLLKVYDELTLRSDFADISVFHKEPPGILEDQSYYVIDTGTIHFNGWKKTGTKERKKRYFAFTFSANLQRLLKQYIAKHKGDKLFVAKPYSKILQNAGTNVTTLRKAKIREVYDDASFTMDERRDLAEKMKHSWTTQLVYAGINRRALRSGKIFSE